MKSIEKVKKLFLSRRYNRILWENIVVKHKTIFYKTLNFFWKVMNPWKNKYEKIKKNIYLIKRYFNTTCRIAPSVVIKDDVFIYIIKQKKVDWEIMKFSDLDNIEVREKLKEIMRINKVFWEEEGLFLDLFWTDIILKPYLIHNLILHEKNIYIFDFWLLDRKSENIIFKLLSHTFYNLQMFLLKFLTKTL